MHECWWLYIYQPPLFDGTIAQASCAAAARAAQDVIADFGVPAADSIGLPMQKLASMSDKHAERDCHSLFSRLKLQMPLAPGYLKTETDLRIPYISVQSWLQMLVDHNCTNITVGLLHPDTAREHAILQEFWARYRENHAEHPIFSKSAVDLGRCIPLLCHGDEGRSKKRQPFLVVNVHSALGRGIEPGLKTATRRHYKKLLCNFVGHSYCTRFLLAPMPKEDFCGEQSWVFDLLISTVAADLQYVADVGVTSSRGTRYWGCCIGVTGDWPWLVKAGGLTRSFMNAPKHKDNEPGAQNGHREHKGVCHLCDAGRPGCLFEEIATKQPSWIDTELLTSPFESEADSPWQQVPHEPSALARLFKFDVFHVVHLGVAKCFLGSFLVQLSLLEDGGSVESRFSQLTTRYLEWCKSNHRPSHCKKISKEHLGWANTKCYPCGTWHKGDLSTQLLKWVEARYLAEAADWSPMLVVAGQAAVALNTFLSRLYHAPAFLSQAEAQEVANYGMRFLRRYNELARSAYDAKKTLWAIQPKFHALAHLILGLFVTSGYTENILMYSVQMDEDFIGRPSRLSRKVSERLCSERVAVRYLEKTYSEWVRCGYFVRTQGN